MKFLVRFPRVVAIWLNPILQWFRSNIGGGSDSFDFTGLEFGPPLDCVEYWITQPFGCEVCNSAPPRLHEGVDFDCLVPEGSQMPVLCIHDGEVIFSGVNPNNSSYGIHVVTECTHLGHSFEILYAHLSAVTLSDNGTVFRGMQIGTLGNTGNAEFDHVHINVAIPGEGHTGTQWFVQNVIDSAPYFNHDGKLTHELPCPNCDDG